VKKNKNILIPLILLPLIFSSCKDEPVTPVEKQLDTARYNWRMDDYQALIIGAWGLDTNNISKHIWEDEYYHSKVSCKFCRNNLRANEPAPDYMVPLVKKGDAVRTTLDNLQEIPEFKKWENAAFHTAQDEDLLLASLREMVFPHIDLIGRASYTTIDVFFKFFPTSLVKRIALGTFRKVYEKNSDAAKRLLHDISFPMHLIPEKENPVPQSIVKLQRTIVTELNKELLALEAETKED